MTFDKALPAVRVSLTLEESELAILHAALICREQHYKEQAAKADSLAAQGAYARAMYAARKIREQLPAVRVRSRI